MSEAWLMGATVAKMAKSVGGMIADSRAKCLETAKLTPLLLSWVIVPVLAKSTVGVDVDGWRMVVDAAPAARLEWS